MAFVPRQIPGPADARVRRVAFPQQSRPEGRSLLQAGLARAIAADRDSLYGSAGLDRHDRAGRTRAVGVQVIAGRYREDLCLLAGEAIEAGGTPSSPVDPHRG